MNLANLLPVGLASLTARAIAVGNLKAQFPRTPTQLRHLQQFEIIAKISNSRRAMKSPLLYLIKDDQRCSTIFLPFRAWLD
jgi:hypothetical protein